MRWLLQLVLSGVCLCLQAHAQRATVDTQSTRQLGRRYIAQSKELASSGQRQEGKAYVQRAIKLFADANLKSDLGYAYWELAGYYDLSPGQYPDKIGYIQQAVNAWHQAGNIKKEADALKELADVRQINDNNEQALAELKQSLNLYLSIGEKALQGVYDLLGEVSCDLGNLPDAVRYGLLAVQTAEQLQDTSLQLCPIYNHVGIAYYYLRELENSNKYYAKALAVAEKYKSYNDIYIISFNYGNNLIRLNKRVESNRHLAGILQKYPNIDSAELVVYTCSFLSNYTALQEFTQAKKYYDQLNLLTRSRPLSMEIQYNVYENKIKYLLATGQNNEARQLLEEEDKFVKDKAYSIMQVSDLQAWISLDSAMGDYRSAFSHFRRYVLLKDSVYNREKARYIAMLNIQYETSKKDQDLLLKAKDIEILKQNNELQQADLKKARQIRNWALAAGLLLAIAVGLFIRIVQIKQRSNKNLERQREEIEKKNASLSQLVQEKEWLVKEIHHRVKNNFHMVIALLGTQSRYLRTSEAIKAITDSQNRIYAMALVHQKLYQSETLSVIVMSEYIQELIHYFRASLGQDLHIRFTADADPVELSLAYCIPLGLIVNEAITNALKYAFPDGKEGEITVAFKPLAEDRFVLKITDNGIGLPDHFTRRPSDSMGMKLINGLSDDLDAKLTIRSDKGTQIIVEFGVSF